MSEERTAKVIELAIAAAGPVGGDPRNWRKKVWGAAAEIGALLSVDKEATGYEFSLAGYTDKLLESSVFRATFVEVRPEYGVNRMTGERGDKPTRMILVTQSDAAKDDDNPEGFEETRTEPLFTEPGRLMAARLRTLQPGDVIQVHKYVDTFKDASNKSKKVRVLTHFDLLWRPQNTADKHVEQSNPESPSPVSETKPSPSAVSPAAQPAGVENLPASAPATSEPGAIDDDAKIAMIQRRIEALTAIKRVEFFRKCGKAGITDPYAPAPDDVAKVVAFLAASEQVSDTPSE